MFQHPTAGVQLPAGTVEPGEDFGSAALREAAEETGLADTQLVGELGSGITELDSVRALIEEAALKTGPRDDAETLLRLPRGYWCRVDGEQEGFAEIVYEELDLNVDPARVIVRYGGWVRSQSLAHRMERRFFHVECRRSTPQRWVHRAEDRFDFECYWIPLVPKPDIQSPQQEWIDDNYDALMKSIGRSKV